MNEANEFKPGKVEREQPPSRVERKRARYPRTFLGIEAVEWLRNLLRLRPKSKLEEFLAACEASPSSDSPRLGSPCGSLKLKSWEKFERMRGDIKQTNRCISKKRSSSWPPPCHELSSSTFPLVVSGPYGSGTEDALIVGDLMLHFGLIEHVPTVPLRSRRHQYRRRVKASQGSGRSRHLRARLWDSPQAHESSIAAMSVSSMGAASGQPFENKRLYYRFREDAAIVAKIESGRQIRLEKRRKRREARAAEKERLRREAEAEAAQKEAAARALAEVEAAAAAAAALEAEAQIPNLRASVASAMRLPSRIIRKSFKSPSKRKVASTSIRTDDTISESPRELLEKGAYDENSADDDILADAAAAVAASMAANRLKEENENSSTEHCEDTRDYCPDDIEDELLSATSIQPVGTEVDELSPSKKKPCDEKDSTEKSDAGNNTNSSASAVLSSESVMATLKPVKAPSSVGEESRWTRALYVGDARYWNQLVSDNVPLYLKQQVFNNRGGASGGIGSPVAGFSGSSSPMEDGVSSSSGRIDTTRLCCRLASSGVNWDIADSSSAATNSPARIVGTSVVSSGSGIEDVNIQPRNGKRGFKANGFGSSSSSSSSSNNRSSTPLRGRGFSNAISCEELGLLPTSIEQVGSGEELNVKNIRGTFVSSSSYYPEDFVAAFRLPVLPWKRLRPPGLAHLLSESQHISVEGTEEKSGSSASSHPSASASSKGCNRVVQEFYVWLVLTSRNIYIIEDGVVGGTVVTAAATASPLSTINQCELAKGGDAVQGLVIRMTDAKFGDATRPIVLRRYPLHQLALVKIGFCLQTVLLGFSDQAVNIENESDNRRNHDGDAIGDENVVKAVSKNGGFVFLTRDKGVSLNILKEVRDLSSQARRRRKVTPETVPTQNFDDEVSMTFLHQIARLLLQL